MIINIPIVLGIVFLVAASSAVFLNHLGLALKLINVSFILFIFSSLVHLLKVINEKS